MVYMVYQSGNKTSNNQQQVFDQKKIQAGAS